MESRLPLFEEHLNSASIVPKLRAYFPSYVIEKSSQFITVISPTAKEKFQIDTHGKSSGADFYIDPSCAEPNLELATLIQTINMKFNDKEWTEGIEVHPRSRNL